VRADIKNAEQQLATIANLSLPDPLEQWHALGFSNPPRLPLPLLQRLLAQLLQEQVYGGLSATAMRKLEAAASAVANNTTKSAPSVSSYSSSASPFPTTSTSASTSASASASASASSSNLLPASKAASRRVSSRQVTLTAGTRLVREWNGHTISVEVVDDHFVWNDAPYRSLSEIARAVTGTRWSGPRFFGIVGRG
jgi:hypothetical protein